MKDPLEHERMRFKSMTQEQLLTRLGRITKIEKLENFTSVARIYKYDFLVRKAQEKLTQFKTPGSKIILTKKTIPLEKIQAPTKSKEKVPEPLIYKRALNF